MARRFPVTTSTPGGSTSAATPYMAIAPDVLGERYGDRPYQAPSASWFNRSVYTIGILHMPIKVDPGSTIGPPYTGGDASGGNSLLYNPPSGGAGFIYQQSGSGTGALQSACSYYAQVGSSTYNTSYASGETTYAVEKGDNRVGGLRFNIFVVDNDTYPDDFWIANGRPQGADGQTNFNGWSDTGAGTDTLSVGGGPGAGNGGFDPIVAMFVHLDAMSFEECLALQMNVLTAKDIPDVDYTGFGTVPDHIWSVKRGMGASGSTPVTSWTSDGATGGAVLTKDEASFRVIELGAELTGA